MDDYLVHYGELQEICEVAIGAWEQFGPGYDADAVDAVAAAGYARALVDVGDAGTADPVLFPGSPVASSSEYVAIMRRMQTGDMMG